MRKEEIKELVNHYSNNGSISIIDVGGAFKLNCTKSNIEISITIPIEVTELFFEAKQCESNIKLEDWSDYYGESEDSDFKDELKSILAALNSSEFRLVNKNKTLEYFNGKWIYCFGEYNEKNYS